ncbi:MAG: CBS domain-containing protein [archaeon]
MVKLSKPPAKIPVGDIMTRNFVSVRPSSSLLDCAKLMVQEKVDSLVIVEGKRLVGIITSRDILWTIVKKPKINLKKVKSLDHATKRVAIIKPSADITEALEKMKQYNFRRLPVISDGEIIGVLTLKDILRVEPTLYHEVGELDAIREESRKLANITENPQEEGFCENCGSFSELMEINNQILCPDCRDELI